MKSKLTALLALLLNAIKKRMSRPLPKTPEALEAFTDEILELGGFDKANISLRNAIVTQVLHLDMSKGSARPMDFIHAINRSIANQLAYQRMQDYKNAEKVVQS